MIAFSTRTACDYSAVVEWDTTEYFVIGRCTTGSRHYSESLLLGDALNMFDVYCGLVDYFGGGVVDLVAHRDGADFYIKHRRI